MNEKPEFDMVEITKSLSVNLLNNTEITSQEAAWYLMREPMSKASTRIVYIPTVWPVERQRIKKTMKELSGLEGESTDIWKENWFDKYERRPNELDDISLAQFVSQYYKNKKGEYVKRDEKKIIRYRNYDVGSDFNEYRREMVTLHVPFRNEEQDILADMKFITIYEENEQTILQQRKEFEHNIDIEKTIQICRELCREETPCDDDEIQDVRGRFPEANPFENLYNDTNVDGNADLRLATLNKLGAIAKRKENVLPHAEFCKSMRMANEKQLNLLLEVIHHLLSSKENPLQIFFTGPAGCGKTFVIKLIMEIYNRFTDNDGYCNAYITCASTGKAAVAINGTTVHTALKISLSKLLPLSIEIAHQYRALFKYVRVLIIDEVSMISAELLEQIDQRLKQITGKFKDNFGGLDMILIGDLRQLPPVRATRIYKQIKRKITGNSLWHCLQFYELTEVMRQANVQFASALTKIGNGEKLTEEELQLIESRFFPKDEANRLCPHGVRLFHSNDSVNKYNNYILKNAADKVISVAVDIYTGCANKEQEAFVKQKLHKMSTIDTGGLPYEITFVKGTYYIITTNIDVSDGLANGTVGKLCHIEYNGGGEVSKVWLIFPNKIGQKLQKKCAGYVAQHNIDRNAVPILRRSSAISMNNNKTINVRRNHFPLVSSCSITIHKSQGGTFDEIVYEYDKSHSIELVYVALSRVTSINGLYITTKDDTNIFHHGRRNFVGTTDIQREFQRLSLNRLPTIVESLGSFISKSTGISFYSINSQSLIAHALDLNDSVFKKCTIVILSETHVRDGQNIDIPNFHCIAKYKRENVAAGGVAIYHNEIDHNNIVTSHMDIHSRASESLVAGQSAIGEICISKCVPQNGREFIVVALYISPGKTVKQIIKFIHQNLLIYTREGSALLDENFHEIPMIMSGDFNINFSDEQTEPLIHFLKDKLDLVMSNDKNQGTTRYGTTIDAVFSRYLEKFESRIYVSYFSYHKPIVSFLEYSTISNDQPGNEQDKRMIIEEITDNDNIGV